MELLSGSRADLGTIATVSPSPKVSVILLPSENVGLSVTLSNSPFVNTLPNDCSRPARFEATSDGSPERANSRSEEHTSELQSLMRISYAVFSLKKKNTQLY